VEGYLRAYPELAQDREVVFGLLRSEWAIRVRGETDLAIDHFVGRFPDFEAELLATSPNSPTRSEIRPPAPGTLSTADFIALPLPKRLGNHRRGDARRSDRGRTVRRGRVGSLDALGGQRAQPCPPQGDHLPRPETFEHPPRPRRPAAPDRLRRGEAVERRLDPESGRGVSGPDRDPRLHAPGASPRGLVERRCPERRLLRRGLALRVADRERPVPRAGAAAPGPDRGRRTASSSGTQRRDPPRPGNDLAEGLGQTPLRPLPIRFGDGHRPGQLRRRSPGWPPAQRRSTPVTMAGTPQNHRLGSLRRGDPRGPDRFGPPVRVA